jgi:CheY-like chemotaxis protein
MSLRALIVDDNAAFLVSARHLLEREGVLIVGAVSTGGEALRIAEEHDLDVILLDIDLGRESGVDLAERLNSRVGDRPPVILISAYPREDLEDFLVGSSAIGFLSKADLSAQAIIEVLGGGDPP